jgi:DNA-binding NtrC family response regulator
MKDLDQRFDIHQRKIMEYDELSIEPSSQLEKALIIGGDALMRRSLENSLRDSNWEVDNQVDQEDLQSFKNRWLLVLICVEQGMQAINILEAFQGEIAEERTYAVVISKRPTPGDLLACIQRGATDYLAWPILPAEILSIANRARKVARYELMQGPHAPSNPIGETDAQGRLLIGNSPIMLELSKQIVRVAFSPGMRVFITGETGTGKEVVARQIHELSGCRGPFRAINCAATIETLLESDLFGHERGSFTGAHTMKKGLWEEAADGTLFLDEISETSLAVQAKLLRVLQEGVIRRVGSNHEVKVTARVIAASNKNIDAAVDDGTFREDLFYRFGHVISLPPLRDRREDIPLLVEHFSRRFSTGKVITKEALDALCAYDWPGNVRQLESVVHRLLLFSSRFVFREDVGQHIPIDRSPDEMSRKTLHAFWSASRRIRRGEWPTISELRNWYVHQVFGVLGKQSAVAKALGIDVRTVAGILQQEDE